jgi:outer membrane protein
MDMRQLFSVLAFALSVVVQTPAQVMSLNQCITYALENNLTYANTHIEATIAREQYLQSNRVFLPAVVGGSSANKMFGRSIDPTTNTFINQDFFSMNFYVDSQLDLFRGFARLNSAKFQRMQMLIKKENAKQQKIAIAFEVMNRYYDVLYFNRLQEIVQNQVELTAINLQKTEGLIELGLKAESDLLEMKAQQAGEQHNLLVARNQYDQALLALKNLMNFPPDEELSVSNEDLDVSADLIPIPELIYNTALQHMPSIKQADFNADAAQKQLSIARGELLPRLSLGAGIYTNYADSRREYLNPGNPENSATRTVPFKNQWEQNMAQSIYLSLQIPIFNKWNGMTQVKRAHLQRTIAFNRQLEEKQKLYQLVHEDVQQLQSLRKERDMLNAKKDALQEAYAVADKKLQQGLISIIEFYTAKNQLAQAEADLMRTLLQLKIKDTTIRYYMGEVEQFSKE